MNKIWMWLFWGLVCILIVSVIATSITISVFFQPGTRIMGKYANISLGGECYFIDKSSLGTVKLTGEKSNFKVHGFILVDGFEGIVNVEAYPMPFKYLGKQEGGSVYAKNRIMLSSAAITFYDDWEVYYSTDIVKVDDAFITVININLKDGRVLTAINGKTEEEAIENYQKYIEALRTIHG